MSAPLDEARELVRGAHHVVVLAGAGVSTASGIPDFRGPQGLWTKDPDAEMLSSFDVWRERGDVRQRAWAARVARRSVVREPNAAHLALVALETRGVLDLLITQNIDGLHHRAGNSAARVVEIHGSEREVVCLRCEDRQLMGVVLDRVEGGDRDPHCTRVVDGAVCDGILKSSTISFGQSLVAADLQRAERAASSCEVLLAVGTTLAVYPIANVVPLARRAGAHVVIVNGAPTEMDHLASVCVRDELTVALPIICAA